MASSFSDVSYASRRGRGGRLMRAAAVAAAAAVGLGAAAAGEPAAAPSAAASVAPRLVPGCGRPLSADIRRGKVTRGLPLAVRDPLTRDATRHYSLFVPSSYSSSRPTPLVLDFHGFYDNSYGEASEDGLRLVAEEEGFLVAYPRGLSDVDVDYDYDGDEDQSGEASEPDDAQEDDAEDWFLDDDYYASWNGGGTNGTRGIYGPTCAHDHSRYPCYSSCRRAGLCEEGRHWRESCASSTCADDVGFVAALLDALEDTLCVDASRVHGTGISNGAIFLYYLATTIVGERLASIVPVAGALLLGHAATPRVPMPVLDIHGVIDDCVPANVSNSWGKYRRIGCPVPVVGHAGCAVSDDGWFYTTLPKLQAAWVEANGCRPVAPRVYPTTGEFDGATGFGCIVDSEDCASAPVIRCTHHVRYNGGHTWPFDAGRPRHHRVRRFGRLVWWFASRFARNTSAKDTQHPRYADGSDSLII